MQAYLEAKEATNDWAVVKQYVEATVRFAKLEIEDAQTKFPDM